jgi:hypothetical protein
VGNAVVYCDSRAVYARDLQSGEAVPWSDDGVVYRRDGPQPADEQTHTLSALGSRVLACLQTDRQVRSTTSGNAASNALIGIDLASEGRLSFSPQVPDDEGWMFAGSPAVSQELSRRGRCYIAMARSSGAAAVDVACFENGEQQWRQRIATGMPIGTGAARFATHSLLTVVEDTVYACTNLGVVAALEADRGDIRWITRYPRSGAQTTNLLERPWFAGRDSAPCLFAEDLLIVAPNDFDGIFALNSHDGRPVWQTQTPPGTLDAIHLLGATHGHLIGSGRRLWWFDLYTGQLSRRVSENPFPRELQSDLHGVGRGLLSGNQVYWPARSDADRIYVFDIDSGRAVRQPIELSASLVSAGNLVLAPGHLLVAGPAELVAFPTAVDGDRPAR